MPYILRITINHVSFQLGDDKQYWRESATALGAMYFFMHGTPFIYQGQEIGMTNVQLPNVEDYDDVATKIYIVRKLQRAYHIKI